ncbi:PucR family transcriptional regulator [Leifsonia sp. 22587]|uniref:PucR family transcriptional regulator n=1 Tax=Leifsonia sp. 22587 TaxID=3453946 RepID=UPI003F83349C
MNESDPGWPMLSRLTRDMHASNPELAAQMAQVIRAELAVYRTSEYLPFPTIVRSTQAHIEAVEDQGSTVDTRDAPARLLGASRARDGIALSDVTDSLRVGTKFLWGRIVDHARATGSATEAELVDLGTELWVMHDEFVQAMTAEYRKEYAQALLSRQQERLGLVYGLLTARGQESASPWTAVDRLGLPRAGGFVIVAASSKASGRMPMPRIESELADREVPSAWVMVGNVQLGIVSTAAAEWRQRLRDACGLWTPTAGVSPVEFEYGNISSSVRLARTALAAAGPGELCFFDDAPVPMAAAGAPDVSRPLISLVLGPLLEAPEAERSALLETLTQWFASDGTVADVANRMWVHQNTVRNRLHRVAALTGRDVNRPRDATELYLALAAFQQSTLDDDV